MEQLRGDALSALADATRRRFAFWKMSSPGCGPSRHRVCPELSQDPLCDSYKDLSIEGSRVGVSSRYILVSRPLLQTLNFCCEFQIYIELKHIYIYIFGDIFSQSSELVRSGGALLVERLFCCGGEWASLLCALAAMLSSQSECAMDGALRAVRQLSRKRRVSRFAARDATATGAVQPLLAALVALFAHEQADARRRAVRCAAYTQLGVVGSVREKRSQISEGVVSLCETVLNWVLIKKGSALGVPVALF